MRILNSRALGAIATAAIAVSGTAQAQTGSAPDPITDYFDHWFERVDAAQASQPHWITPVATTTPRLEEEFRYDQFFERLPNGAHLFNYDGGKGLELIPTERTELIIGLPPYQERDTVKPATGWNDWPFLLVKYRLLSANEEQGNYILTAFLQGSAPTGNTHFTSHAYTVTPTIAGGFGFGDFDVQSTLGVSFPTSMESTIGKAVAWNTTLQYHLWNVLWPEIEFNDTYWSGGLRGRKNQLFVTPGVVVGRMPLCGRTKLIIGLGYQMAIEPSHVVLAPVLTPTYTHNFILTTRVTF